MKSAEEWVCGEVPLTMLEFIREIQRDARAAGIRDGGGCREGWLAALRIWRDSRRRLHVRAV